MTGALLQSRAPAPAPNATLGVAAGSRNLSGVLDDTMTTLHAVHQLADRIAARINGPDPTPTAGPVPPAPNCARQTAEDIDGGLILLVKRLEGIAQSLGA